MSGSIILVRPYSIPAIVPSNPQPNNKLAGKYNSFYPPTPLFTDRWRKKVSFCGIYFSESIILSQRDEPSVTPNFAIFSIGGNGN